MEQEQVEISIEKVSAKNGTKFNHKVLIEGVTFVRHKVYPNGRVIIFLFVILFVCQNPKFSLCLLASSKPLDRLS